MANRIEDCVQRGHHYAIVDEVDSILIDEARTPLIISGPSDESVKWYDQFATLGRPAAQRRRLRGRREEAHRLGARGRHRAGRGPPRHRQPVRRGQHAADLVPQQRDQGQGALPPRPRLRRHRGRGADRRRAHRPHAARPPLQRGPAPGDRGQGEGEDPRGVPDPRHHHPAELLPPLREARRHDRYGDDRGLGVRQDLQARRDPDPDQPADGARRPARPGLPHRGRQVRRDRRRHRASGTPTASRCWSAPPRSRSPSTCPSLLKRRGIPHTVLNAKQHAERGAHRRAGRPPGRRHRRHQHGRPRHRHHAGRLGRVLGRRGAARQGPRPHRALRGVRGGLARGNRARSRSRSRPSTTRSTTPAACT